MEVTEVIEEDAEMKEIRDIYGGGRGVGVGRGVGESEGCNENKHENNLVKRKAL